MAAAPTISCRPPTTHFTNWPTPTIATLAFSLIRMTSRPLRASSTPGSRALSHLEMSFDGRNFSNLGRKIVPRQPLAHQMVALDDSVLGFPMTTGKGLNTTYRDMIAAAFRNEWWDSDWTVLVNPDGSLSMSPPGTVSGNDLTDTSSLAHHFLLIEYNFPLIWGLAVQMYEAT